MSIPDPRPFPGTRIPRRLHTAAHVVFGFILWGCGVVLCVIGSLNATGAGGALAVTSDTPPSDAQLALTLLGAVLWLTVFVRRPYPFVLLASGGILALIGMDYALMLIGAANVVLRRRGPVVGWTAGGAAALVLLTLGRDALRTPLRTAAGGMLAATPDGSAVESPHRWAVAAFLGFVAVTAYGLTVGLALLARTRREKRAALGAASSATQSARSATAELHRRSERDRFAQEVHDTLAHRLSLISLQSGALQVRSQAADPQLAQAADDLRHQAHASLQDLRGLLGELGEQGQPVEPPVSASLRAVPELVRSTRAAGATIDAVVLVDSATSASGVLDHGAYRIVQESLTNAIKHAPGAPVELYVSADPVAGVRIRALNPLPPTSADAPGTGAGLEGIRERVRILGGTSWIGAHAGVFLVDVTLPWTDGA